MPLCPNLNLSLPFALEAKALGQCPWPQLLGPVCVLFGSCHSKQHAWLIDWPRSSLAEVSTMVLSQRALAWELFSTYK